MKTTLPLEQAAGFTSRAHIEEVTAASREEKATTLENPIEIDVVTNGAQETVLSAATDAIDCMAFIDMTPAFLKLTGEQALIAAICLKNSLTNHFGGKDFLICDSSLASTFEQAGFSAIPKIPNGNPYKRLMHSSAAMLEQKLRGVYASHQALLNTRHAGQAFSITHDKAQMLAITQDISQLFIENAPYATADEGKKRAYSAPAIELRIQNNNVSSFAAIDNGKLIGFMRAYVNKENNYAYVSDLVVTSDQRNKGTALALMAAAQKALGETVKDVFLIAGDDKEEAYYKDTLGFKNIYLTAEKSPLTLSNNRSFLFALLPQKDLLKNLIGGLPLPETEQEVRTFRFRN